MARASSQRSVARDLSHPSSAAGGRRMPVAAPPGGIGPSRLIARRTSIVSQAREAFEEEVAVAGPHRKAWAPVRVRRAAAHASAASPMSAKMADQRHATCFQLCAAGSAICYGHRDDFRRQILPWATRYRSCRPAALKRTSPQNGHEFMIAVWSMNSINHRITIKDLADAALDDPSGSG